MVRSVGIETQIPSPTLVDPTISDAGFFYPSWMADDGAEAWSWSSTGLRVSTDDWQTTTLVHSFSMAITGLRQLADGELLVSLQKADDSVPGELWKSSGYTRANPSGATWSKVLTFSSNGVYAIGSWNLWVHDEYVFAAEYGAKTAGANARYVYRSTDSGETWTAIYDHEGEGRHVHGVAYDRWADRVWVVLGDGSGNWGIVYSDDWQDETPTWATLSSTVQPVGVMPMADCVLFGNDHTDNAIYRWDRTTGELGIAVQVETSGQLTMVTGQMFRRSESHPVLIPFAQVPGVTGPGELWATYDGATFYRLWRDAQTYTGKGLVRVVGPTASGNLLGHLNDDRQTSASLWKVAAPTWSQGWS